MTVTWQGFDECYHRMYQRVWQACFLTTGSVKAADDHCFRAFLVLGASKNAEHAGETMAEEAILLHACAELARKWYAGKPRRRLTRRYLDRYPLKVPVSDEMLGFLHLPLNRRIVSAGAAWGLAGEQLLKAAGFRFLHPQPADLPDLTGVEPAPELMHDMQDRIYVRFAERSVAVENSIHRAGRRFDRIAPFLALAVLALFVFAYFYVEKLR